MKSKFPPLALGGAIAGCALVVGLAVWTLTSTGASEGVRELDEGPRKVAPAARAGGPTTVPVAGAEGSGAGEASRVALTDDSKPLSLPQVEFELLSSSDEPLTSARVVIFRGEEVLGASKSDASGVVHFDARDGQARAVVFAPSTPAFVRDVSLAAGRQKLSAVRGVVVAGRVRTIDDSTVQGVVLRLVSDRPLVDDGQWPAAVVKELELRTQDKLALRVTTEEDGAFEFTGLSAPWSGRLELGEEHELLGVTGGVWSRGAESIRLDDPTEALVLEIAAMPKAVGRIVLTAGGPGVPRATINANLLFEPRRGTEDDGTAVFSGAADGEGRFELPIRRTDEFTSNDPVERAHWPPLKLANLTLDAGEDIPRRRLELRGEQLPEGFDFGELVLERGATLAFVAVDGQSKPLAGAVGRLDGERSEPTDETGRATISYSPGVGRPLMVTLDGYKEGRAEVPKEPVDALQVQLARTTRLDVLVLGPDRTPVSNVALQVTQPQGSSRPGGRRNQNNEQRTNDEGRASFSNLTPQVQLKVTARDAMGAALAEQSLTLEPEEWRTLELEVPRALLSFSGVVRDEQGLPLAEANVELSEQVQGRNNISTRTDPDGHFSFGGLTSPAAILRVRKTGFAPVTISDFRIPPPGVLADIRLERGLRLTLRVVDDHGAPVRGENLRMELAGERPFGGRRRGESEWEFSNLPRLSMTAVGTVGGREYRRDIEPLNGDQEFRVPAQGGLEVVLRLAEPSLLQENLRMNLRARDNGRVNFSQGLAHETLQTKTFAPLLPGDYQLSVLRYVQTGERGDWSLVGAAQRVTVQAGGNQRLEVER